MPRKVIETRLSSEGRWNKIEGVVERALSGSARKSRARVMIWPQQRETVVVVPQRLLTLELYHLEL